MNDIVKREQWKKHTICKHTYGIERRKVSQPRARSGSPDAEEQVIDECVDPDRGNEGNSCFVNVGSERAMVEKQSEDSCRPIRVNFVDHAGKGR